jgi:hypothetical protein
MKILGNYYNGGLEMIPCEIVFFKGVMNVRGVMNKKDKIQQPFNKKHYEIIKTKEVYNLPTEHKYAIRYINYFGDSQYILTDITIFQKWWIKISKYMRNMTKKLLSKDYLLI